MKEDDTPAERKDETARTRQVVLQFTHCQVSVPVPDDAPETLLTRKACEVLAKDLAAVFDGSDTVTIADHAMNQQKRDLINLAAELLRSGPSPFQADWPKSTPKTVIRALEKHDDSKRVWALRIRQIADALPT